MIRRGGNATLVTLLRAKAAGDRLPSCAVGLSPVVDSTLSSRSLIENERSDALFRLATLLLLARNTAPPERMLDPFVSPLYGDLAGLPPLLLQAGSREMLRDESVRFAETRAPRASTSSSSCGTACNTAFSCCNSCRKARARSNRSRISCAATRAGLKPFRPRRLCPPSPPQAVPDTNFPGRLPCNAFPGQDALFLHLDQPHTASHATLIYIYDQSEFKGEPLRFRDIVQHVEQRLDASPLFRRRIVQVAMGLGYPYWEDDANFDIDFHIRHFALPKPGDWRQFCILASRIHARTLDLTRPPWEMYVIEGLDNFDWLPKGSSRFSPRCTTPPSMARR